jgi:solute carrier family 50 protein (sugar transporter)
MTVVDLIVQFIFPLFGTIICNILWLTPLPVVLEARYTRYLGPLNPYPFVITAFGNIGWTVYGCMRKDPFLFSSSFTGLVLGFYYTIVCLTVIAKRDANADFSNLYVGVETCLLCGILFWSIMGWIIAVGFSSYPDPFGEATKMVGMICAFSSVAYYASPLTSLYEVVVKKDSSSLYLPLLVINLINSGLWFIYGLVGTGDPNLYIPNICSMTLASIQLFMRLTVPVKEKHQTQTWEHVLHLIQGKIPPTFETSQKILLSRSYSRLNLLDSNLNLVDLENYGNDIDQPL